MKSTGKALFAHILTTYDDIKFEEGKGVLPEYCMGELRAPGNVNVMFRTPKK